MNDFPKAPAPAAALARWAMKLAVPLCVMRAPRYARAETPAATIMTARTAPASSSERKA